MKTCALTLLLSLASPMLTAGSYQIPPEASLEQVTAILGAPSGSLADGDTTTYLFAAGEVSFKNDRLVSSQLKSPEEMAAAAKVVETMRKESSDRTEKAKSERLTRGERVRQDRATDPTFLALPASQRLAAWKEFRVQYPEISVQKELDAAFREWQVEGSEQRLAELNATVEALRSRLTAKEREAADLKSDRDIWKARYDELNTRLVNTTIPREFSPTVIVNIPAPAPTPVPKPSPLPRMLPPAAPRSTSVPIPPAPVVSKSL